MDDEAEDAKLVEVVLSRALGAESDAEAQNILASELTTHEALGDMQNSMMDFLISSVRRGLAVGRIVHLMPTAVLEEYVMGIEGSGPGVAAEIATSYPSDQAIALTERIYTEIARRRVALTSQVPNEVDFMWARLVMHEIDMLTMVVDARSRGFALEVLKRYLKRNPGDRSINTFTLRVFLMHIRTWSFTRELMRGEGVAALLAAADAVLPTLPDDVDVDELSRHLRSVIAWPDWNRLDLQAGLICDVAVGLQPLEDEDVKRCYHQVMAFDFSKAIGSDA